MTATLAEMAYHYHVALADGSPALSYLRGRGMSELAIASHRLGVVDGAYPEHAEYRGRIAIPYTTKLGGVHGFKFRYIGESDDEAKYKSSHMPVRLYNTAAFDAAEKLGYIGISEGEFDAIILTSECGIPTVGVPGVDTYTKHKEWRLLFDGFQSVLIFRDQDEPGLKLAQRILSDLDRARIVNLPSKDPNETFLKHGREAIRNAAGLD